MPETLLLRIRRRKNAHAPQFWDTFEIPYRPNQTVISALEQVRRHPQNVQGHLVDPPVWEAACLEEVCGSCTMYVNGTIRQACAALVEDVAIEHEGAMVIQLEPMRKFPVVRDLIVDRGKMFSNLAKVRAWVPIDGSYDLGPAPPQDDRLRSFRYALSCCMTCGCCMEACPQVNERSPFTGPATLAQALLFNLHPVGRAEMPARMEYLTSSEGITGCGNAQNCVKACPKHVPLTHAIAQLNRDTTVYKLKQWIGAID